MNREKLIEILSKYFSIGDSDTYCLTRVKEGFAVGTVTIDDFVEWDEENIADLADYILKNTADEVTLNINLGDRTPEEIKQIAEMFNGEIKKQVAKEILQALQSFTTFTKEEYKEIAKKFGVEVDE